MRGNNIKFIAIVVLTPESTRQMLADTLLSLKPQQTLTCTIECTVLVPGPKNLFSWVPLAVPGVVSRCIEYYPSRLGEGVNQAVSGCQAYPGDWVVLVKSGDVWLEHAFSSIGEFLTDKPSCRVLTVDESQKVGKAETLSYCHKPEWNPDWLWDAPYMQRGVLVEFGLLGRLGKFSEYSGITTLENLFQELLLRAETDSQFEVKFFVNRLPQTLLSTLLSEDALEERLPEKLLSKLAKKCDSRVCIVHKEEGRLKVCWSLPAKLPKVSLIVPTRNGISILKPCVDAILKRTDYSNFELIIIDNQSDCPETLSYMQMVEKADSRVSVFKWNQRFNYSAINNFGVSKASGEIIGLVNNDVEPLDGAWLTEMVRHCVFRPIVTAHSV